MAKRTSRRRTSKRAPALVPNAPIDRLGFIRKTYEKTQPWVVLDTLGVIFNTVGVDHPLSALTEELERLIDGEDLEAPRFEAQPRKLRSMVRSMGHGGNTPLHDGLVRPSTDDWGDFTPYRAQLAYWWWKDEGPNYADAPTFASSLQERLSLILELVESPTFADGAMREPSEADGIFPWVARELSKLSKHTISALDATFDPAVAPAQTARSAMYGLYAMNLSALRQSGNAIAQWSKATRVDIMKMSLDEVLEASKSFRAKQKVVRGEVVYKFKSGWTVESLRGKKQLDCEAGFLAHCVYSYVGAVERGESVIYSLRDPDGVPYVTMEWHPWRKGDPPPPEGTKSAGGVFKQVFGHGNSKIGNKRFNEYVLSAGQDNEPPLTAEQVPETVELIRAMVVEFIDKVKGGEVRGLVLARANLSGRDLTGAKLSGVNLAKALLHETDFSGADLSSADLSSADLRDTNLSSADLRNANLWYADLRDANLRGADLSSAELVQADLTGAKYDAKTVWPDSFDPNELWHRGAVKV